MLTTQDLSMASGINGVEWDAVELPSQVTRDALCGAARSLGRDLAWP